MNAKNILRAALSMTAALVMTACTNDDSAIESSAQQGAVKTIPYTVTVGQEEAAGTRATVDNDLKTLRFAEGDKLYVSCDTRTDLKGELTLKSDDKNKTSGATFEGSLTYTGDDPTAGLEIKATLVSAQQRDATDNPGPEVTINSTNAVVVNYPRNAFYNMDDAVKKYSRLTGTSTYGKKSFTLTQQTAFLNFVITFEDNTGAAYSIGTVVSNGGNEICNSSLLTTNENGKVVLRFVLPVAKGTKLNGATVKFGDRAPIPFGAANQTLEGKVYNVTKTVTLPLNNTTTTWSAVTYAVPEGGMTFNDAIRVSGNVTLVLTDGATLTLNKGISIALNTTLTIQGNGTMNVNGTNGNTTSNAQTNGTLVLTSGTLTATGGNGASVSANQDNTTANAGGVAINSSVIVNGGTLTATGGDGGSVASSCMNCNGGAGGAAISGYLTINGGTVTITNGADGSNDSSNNNCTAGAGGAAVVNTVADNRPQGE